MLKAKVKPSQRMSDKHHEAWTELNKGIRDITSAHCSYMTRLVIKNYFCYFIDHFSLGEKCSHVQ